MIRENIIGLGKCPICGEPVQMEYGVDPDKQKAVFHAVCTNEKCGCNSGNFDSLRYLQDLWSNKDVGSAAAPVELDSEGFVPSFKKPSKEDTIAKNEGNSRWYRLMNVIAKGAPDYIVGFYDGHEYRRIGSNEIIEDAVSYKFIDSCTVEITKEQADAMRS